MDSGGYLGGTMRIGLLSAILMGITLGGAAHAAKVSDVTNTKHNLSTSSTGTVKATSESGICVFCHTPHNATIKDQAGADITGAPLWNRAVPAGGKYTIYTSSSLQATTPSDISNSSKLCLTCHDGTQAIGAVNVMVGGTLTDQNPATGEIAMVGGADYKMTGAANLGVDLRNDHPISITYDTTLAGADKELHDPATAAHIVNGYSGRTTDVMPLNNGKVECASCHDPHLYDPAEDIKFLRLNRFQSTTPPSGSTFTAGNDIICIACHKKEGWAESAHAKNDVATETYTTAAATARGFPDGLPVYRAACLNCHDPHTVQGAQRLQRQLKTEQTCYQCHSNTPILTDATQVPNIEKDFQLTYKMPLDKDKVDGTEMHTILDGDFTEAATTLSGPTNDNTMRHAECTDCHNPHRVAINTQADLGGSNLSATHEHQAGVPHTNEASGVLRGTWGVEPNYGGSIPFATILDQTTGYTVKKGLGVDAVTKEYQVCLKCHSSYAFGTNPPPIGASTNKNLFNSTNKMTDQAMEFAPLNSVSNTGAAAAYAGAPNHRSWHPVIGATGRTTASRSMASANAFRAPWNTAVGTQTMYCSDCHGSDNSLQNGPTPSSPDLGQNSGPHGSSNPFILKGLYDVTPASTAQAGYDVCFKCHDYNAYGNPTPPASPSPSGFSMVGNPAMCLDSTLGSNLHLAHAKTLGKLRCSWCHTAVPHGWKNKALLVNLNDVGPEVGELAGTVKPAPYTSAVNGNPPYYVGARLIISSFATSGNWTANNCSGAMNMMMTCSGLP